LGGGGEKGNNFISGFYGTSLQAGK